MKRLFLFIAIVSSQCWLAAAQPRVAILGDSITYAGRWTVLVESALRATPEFAGAAIVNFGLPSETVSGLSEPGHAGGKFPRPDLHERLARVLEAFKPTLVLACYGMNDGIYLPLDAARRKAYQDGAAWLKSAAENSGAKVIFMTPPLFDADRPADDAKHYDAVLDAEAQWLLSRRADGWQVVDIRPDLRAAIEREKRANPNFIYSRDGIHPGDEGHRFIAESAAQQLWPMLNLPGTPQFASDDALKILSRRNELLKLAWLTHTRHQRPGIPAGLPLNEAQPQAAALLDQYSAAAGVPRISGVSTVTPVTQDRDHAIYNWQKRHQEVIERNQVFKPDVVIIGDSIIHYWSGEPAAPIARGAQAWTNCFAGLKVTNLGFGWDRTENVLWRIENGELSGIKPRVIIIKIGTNNTSVRDRAGDIADGIMAVCDAAHRQQPDAKILLLALLPRPDEKTPRPTATEKVNALLPARTAGIGWVTYCDFGGAFRNADGTVNGKLFCDGVHPNAAGYEVLGGKIREQLNALLNATSH